MPNELKPQRSVKVPKTSAGGSGHLVATQRPALLPEPKISMDKLVELSTRAEEMMAGLRGSLLAPDSKKTSPPISSTRLAALCGVDKAHLAYRVTRNDLPKGLVTATGGRREFTLAEAQLWTREYRAELMRPPSKRAITMASSNFKGGSNKTTTAMVLAQGLALRGHKVLAIDCDPQGSLSTLFGLLPGADIEENMTILPLCSGQEQDLRYAVRSTYWSGLDLIAAAPLLFDAEFYLPSQQLKDPTARFWDVLNVGLEPLREHYDVIVIDTPPSLSYVTINALFAADGLIVPIPPSALDYASLSQFWSLFTDLGVSLSRRGGQQKDFDFVHVLLSNVETDRTSRDKPVSDSVVASVRRWVQTVYGEYLLPVEIPKTAATTSKAADFGTVYDVQRNEISPRTYKRALDAYDRLVELVEGSVVQAWANQVAR